MYGDCVGIIKGVAAGPKKGLVIFAVLNFVPTTKQQSMEIVDN
jgi:hypothetical protein